MLVAAGAALVVATFGASAIVVAGAVVSAAAGAGDEGFRSMDLASEIWVGAGIWWDESSVVAVGSVVLVAVGLGAGVAAGPAGGGGTVVEDWGAEPGAGGGGGYDVVSKKAGLGLFV